MPDERAVKAQLARILGSASFSKSGRLSSFLTFVVEESLRGGGDSLKETVLARELYNKGSDFDTASDPVVRIDARRLRDKLREYYSECGSDPVLVTVPKGTYAPVFEWNPDLPTRIVATMPPRAEPRSLPQRSSYLRPRFLWMLCLCLFGLIVSSVWFFRSNPDESGSSVMPLTSLPGSEGPPSLSPDGQLVAFDWKANDPQTQFRHIFSKEVRGEARRQLSDGAGEYNAAWSPDGSRIAFIRGGQGVFVTSQLGGADQRISETGTHVGWTADSKSLLIRDKPTEAGQPNPPFGIYQISLDTRVKRQITQGAKGVGDWVFSVSPDGKNLAFARYGLPGVGDVYVVPMSGGEPRRLTNWAGSGISVAWTPDGREIVYTVTEPQGGRIWRIPWNTSKPGRGRPLANQTGDANFVSISRPAGNRPARLAYQVEYIDTDLSLVDLTAVSDGKFTSFQPLAESTRVETKARFSPDATKVAFASNRSGIKEIWVCNRDGSDVTQLTSLGGSDTLPGYWSPDGRMLLLQATVEGNSDVYVVPSNGGKPKRLTHDSSLHMAPSWSRDGKWIYFSAVPLSGESHRPQIWKMQAEGGNAIQLTRYGGFFQQESFDGKFLYFLDRPQDSASDLGNLMRIPVNGGDAVKVLGGIRGDLWSLTRKGVFFVTKDNNQDAIRLFQFEDGKEIVAGILTFRISAYGGGMSVSEDGRWLLTNQTKRRDTDLMLIENFR